MGGLKWSENVLPLIVISKQSLCLFVIKYQNKWTFYISMCSNITNSYHSTDGLITQLWAFIAHFVGIEWLNVVETVLIVLSTVIFLFAESTDTDIK